jgi:hypothetical protein
MGAPVATYLAAPKINASSSFLCARWSVCYLETLASRRSSVHGQPCLSSNAALFSWIAIAGQEMVGEAGLEPTTPGLEGRCSIQLSYSPVAAIVPSSGTRLGFHQADISDHC